MPTFASIDDAVQALQGLQTRPLRSRGAWDLPQVLHHVAQSVEYSMQGFPQLKAPLFRATVGRLAFGVFNWRGRMRHGLAEPIPGAPAIAAGLPLAGAVERAVTALRNFERHAGPLQPHFAYGALDKEAYTQAHLLHLADHWRDWVT